MSKPLQYINATNIEDGNIKDAILIDAFYEADIFQKNIEQYSAHWESVKLYRNSYLAIIHIIFNRRKYSKLFLDSDYGIFLGLFLFLLPTLSIYTYEEGYASYIVLGEDRSGFKYKTRRFLASMLGMKEWIGGHPLTKGMYLYQPEKFIKNIGDAGDKKIMSFKATMFTHMTSLKEIEILIDSVDLTFFKDKDVVMYLSNYYINKDMDKYLTMYNGYYKVAKPHPKWVVIDEYFSKFDYIIPPNIPAEILIIEILKECKNLVLVHEGSFVLEYFENHPKMHLIKLAS